MKLICCLLLGYLQSWGGLVKKMRSSTFFSFSCNRFLVDQCCTKFSFTNACFLSAVKTPTCNLCLTFSRNVFHADGEVSAPAPHGVLPDPGIRAVFPARHTVLGLLLAQQGGHGWPTDTRSDWREFCTLNTPCCLKYTNILIVFSIADVLALETIWFQQIMQIQNNVTICSKSQNLCCAWVHSRLKKWSGACELCLQLIRR